MHHIRDWPKGERPRERLLEAGAAALSDAELLAIFLRSGLRGESAVSTARRLLQHFGGLAPLLDAELSEQLRAPGLGLSVCACLRAAQELTRRRLLGQLGARDVLSSPQLTRRYLRIWLQHKKHEQFVALFLDNRHRVICAEVLAEGTIDGASVYPREVVKRTLAVGAAALIFAHNHPSGVAEPSDADRRITRRLSSALSLIDVRVLDHIVVGEGEAVSFAERGLL